MPTVLEALFMKRHILGLELPFTICRGKKKNLIPHYNSTIHQTSPQTQLREEYRLAGSVENVMFRVGRDSLENEFELNQTWCLLIPGDSRLTTDLRLAWAI